MTNSITWSYPINIPKPTQPTPVPAPSLEDSPGESVGAGEHAPEYFIVTSILKICMYQMRFYVQNQLPSY